MPMICKERIQEISPVVRYYEDFYGDERIITDGLIPSLRLKLSSLSEFMQEIKVNFGQWLGNGVGPNAINLTGIRRPFCFLGFPV